MNTVQLRRALRRITNKGDVCPADLLPSVILRKPKFYIVNTDVSGRPGSHWVTFYFPRRGPPEFFDPAGRAPEHYHRRFRNVLMINGPRYLYSGHRVQDYDSPTCGHFFLYYVFQRRRGFSMSNIVSTSKTLHENEVIRFVQKHLR
jgi:hypothetical protein